MSLLQRKRQIVVAIEGNEGTAATIAATDGKMQVYDLEFSLDPNMQDRDPARSTLTPLDGIVGKQSSMVRWRTELKGSGALATRPSWDKALRCCGFTAAAVSTISVGAISGGPLQPGETITGSSSAATGRIVGEIATGVSMVHYVPTSGTFNSDDVFTGGTSGATCASAGDPAGSKGWEYKPASSSIPSATLAAYLDGTRGVGAGGRGNVRISGNVGELVFLEFEFSAVYESYTDQSLLSITYETATPKPLLDSGHRFDGSTTPFAALNIDMANTVAERTDARASKGILSYLITERAPTLSIDPEDVLVATKDYRGRLVGANTGYFFAKIGSVAGNKIVIGAPRIQYRSVGEGERNRIATANLEFGLVAVNASSGDGEIQIAMI